MTGEVKDFLKVRELNVTHKPLVAVASGTTYAAEVNIKSDVKLGSSASAVQASINLGTTGSVHGEGSSLYGEMVPPNGSLSRGALYCLGLGMGAQASSTWGSAGPVAFIKYDSWGSGTIFDTTGHFWDIQGLTEASGSVFSEGGGALTTAGTLKIRIGAATFYIMLSSNEAN